MPTPAEISATAARLRGAIEQPYSRAQAAASIAAVGPPDTRTTAAIAERLGWSAQLLGTSFQHLCAPFASAADLWAVSNRFPTRRGLVGFVMPGNIPGAGLHELVLTLLTGSAALIKTATAEPLFFAHWAKRLAALDPHLGARLAVFNWSRERADLTRALRRCCDRLVVLGDDTTLAELDARDAADDDDLRAEITGFGARVSGVVLTAGACTTRVSATTMYDVTYDVACDVALFEQRGCLSPHHVFVGDSTGETARAVAARLADKLRVLNARPLPPPSRLALGDAIAIRSVRERARWRALGGHQVTLWEGPLPSWTVIYDRDASFCVSTGFRTIFVSSFANPEDLARRLEAVSGRVEAFAFKADSATDTPCDIAQIRAVLERAGATYICDPGRMQSPPLDWPHGRGAFIRELVSKR